MQHHLSSSTSALLIGAMLLVPSFAFALVNTSAATAVQVVTSGSVPTGAAVGASASVSAQATVSGKTQAVLDAKTTKARDRGDTEIERRITSLTDLSNAVNAMIKITADAKASLTASIQSQIGALTALKTTIDADTDPASLKNDIASITKGYRTYMLILPQGRITAAADKIQFTTSLSSDLATKLQARISAAQASGAAVGSLSDALTDLNAKIADANTQAAAAVAKVAPLTPDNGDQTVAASNTKTLTDARADIKVAMSDLKAARKDIGTIVAGLKKIEPATSAAVTATSTVSHN